jgi:lysyl endopeptidase
MKISIIVFAILFITISLSAQVVVSTYSQPNMTRKGLFGKTEKVYETVIAPIQKLNALQDINKMEHKFAEPKSVDISPLAQASKEIINDDIIYREKIIAQGATSITISFDRLTLSKNAQLYIYNDNGTIITGPITTNENIGKDRLWSSNTFHDSSIILELKVPLIEQNQNDLHISKVLFGLSEKVNLNSLDSAGIGHFNTSSPCNINVLCSQGNPWINERQAVCLIETDDGAACSGALLNNTCNVNRPYVLTAWHCTNGRNPNNWTYSFGWWSATCTPNTYNQQFLLFNGATLRATYEPTDFSLLELFQTPSATSSLTYLGWSRSSVAPSTSVGIHHPMDDQMKISFANNPATVGNIRLNNNTAWRVLWNSGTTEEGSSGSPLFNQDHRVVGQNYSENQPTYPPCNQQTGGNNYGRLDLSWTGGGTPPTELSYWLDPSNSGAMTTNTIAVSAMTPLPAMSISGADLFCSGTQTYTLNNAPVGSTIIWNAVPSGYASLAPHGTSVDVTMLNTGAVTLTASINFPNCYPAIKIVHMGTYGSGDYPVSGPSSTSCNYYVTYTTNQLPGATSYTWFYPSGWTYVDGQGTYMLTLIAKGSTGNYQVGVRVNNTCGTGGSYAIKNTFLSGCTGSFVVSPNPATSSVNVAPATSSTSGHTTFTEINIYDQVGNVKKHEVFGKTKSANINVSDLVTGIYIIEIVDGTYRERQKLQVLKN